VQSVEPTKLKNWFKEGLVESFDVFIKPREMNEGYEKTMAEIQAVLTSNRLFKAMPIGCAFGALFWQGSIFDEFGRNLEKYLTGKRALIVNKRVYITAMQLANQRTAVVNQSSPASISPGARIDRLIEEATVCPFPKLGLWLAQALKEHSFKFDDDLEVLDSALRARCASAIDAAFKDAEAAHRKEPQDTSPAEAKRIAKALFQQDSFATLRNLREHLALALAGAVPSQEREKFKALLLNEIRAEFDRAFMAIASTEPVQAAKK
jgi:hypothetical protein